MRRHPSASKRDPADDARRVAMKDTVQPVKRGRPRKQTVVQSYSSGTPTPPPDPRPRASAIAQSWPHPPPVVQSTAPLPPLEQSDSAPPTPPPRASRWREACPFYLDYMVFGVAVLALLFLVATCTVPARAQQPDAFQRQLAQQHTLDEALQRAQQPDAFQRQLAQQHTLDEALQRAAREARQL